MIYKNEILLSQVQFSYFCLNFSIMKISIDHNSAIPLYLQIENQLRNIIREPEYKKGKMLPNEVDLSKQLGISRNTLRQAILKGELAPGERLMEIQLAEKLGVSRTPIREAIRKLELEGLVLMIPRKGAEVAKISEKSLRDVLAVRRSLEELAIELASERMEAEDLRRLEQCQENFCRAIRSGSPMEMAESDEAFHDVIYQSTGNEKLVQMLNNLREQMYRYRLEYIKDADKRQVLMVEHEHILSALQVRNLAEARMAAREHIDNQEITVSKNIKEQEENVLPVRGRR